MKVGWLIFDEICLPVTNMSNSARSRSNSHSHFLTRTRSSALDLARWGDLHFLSAPPLERDLPPPPHSLKLWGRTGQLS